MNWKLHDQRSGYFFEINPAGAMGSIPYVITVIFEPESA